MNESEFSQDLDGIKTYLNQIMAMIQQAVELKLELVEVGSKGITLMLPYNQFIVGDPETGVIHGGALATLLDQCLGASMGRAVYPDNYPSPTIDLRVDYVKVAKPLQPVYAYGEVYRVTKSVVFTKCVAYQENSDNPIAHGIASFMRMKPDDRKLEHNG